MPLLAALNCFFGFVNEAGYSLELKYHAPGGTIDQAKFKALDDRDGGVE